MGAGRLQGAGDHIGTLDVCVRGNQVLLCIYAYPLHVFDIAKHETMGYKLAFQLDIFDMISASHLVSLLFVSFLP